MTALGAPAVLDGAASQLGDTATFTFAAPLDKTVPGFAATMAVGSGDSFQGVDGHACGTVPQFSTIMVNGQLLSGCAGNYDDGLGANGALITVRSRRFLGPPNREFNPEGSLGAAHSCAVVFEVGGLPSLIAGLFSHTAVDLRQVEPVAAPVYRWAGPSGPAHIGEQRR